MPDHYHYYSGTWRNICEEAGADLSGWRWGWFGTDIRTSCFEWGRLLVFACEGKRFCLKDKQLFAFAAFGNFMGSYVVA